MRKYPITWIAGKHGKIKERRKKKARLDPATYSVDGTTLYHNEVGTQEIDNQQPTI